MSVIEIAYLPLIDDEATIGREWPLVSNKIIDPNPGIIIAAKGLLNDEESRKLTGLLVIEWQSQSAFFDFTQSDQVKEFQQSVRPLLTGPPVLELFNGDRHIPVNFNSKSVIDIVRVSLTSKEYFAKVQGIWESIGLPATIVVGTSFNTNEDIFVAILLWNTVEERSIVGDECLAPLSTVGEISRYAAHITPIRQ